MARVAGTEDMVKRTGAELLIHLDARNLSKNRSVNPAIH